MKNARVRGSYFGIIVAFGILILRYGYLQLIDHGTLLQKSISNYSSIVAAIPVRGGIIDRNGVILADNKVSYVIAGLPRNLKDSEQIFSALEKYINLTSLDKKKYYLELANSKNYDWVILKDDLSNTEIAKLTAHNYEFPELSIFARTKRYYPFEDLYAHSIGYVARLGALDQQKINNLGRGSEYLANDYIGKNGLEQFYENSLRGKLGKKIIQTDALGNEIRLLTNYPAADGYTLKLTLDHSLQAYAKGLLKGKSGAIVALDPQTGGILAFVSNPSFDPNWFIDGISTDDWTDLVENEAKPLLNRASQGTYPPGSTFKPFLALAALQEGIRTPNSTMIDPGYYVIPGTTHKFRDSKPGGFGKINFMDAIKLSSDAYFYKLGLDLGIDKIYKNMSLFGFGQKTGIDLPHENSGLLPSRAWKAKRFAKNSELRPWLLADSVNIGVGQGFNNYTPLQMALATSIIANEGVLIKPHFLDQVINKNGEVVESYSIQRHNIPINQSYFQLIKLAMQKVVTEGTAKSINAGLNYTMAGKTGTAQVVGLKQNSRVAKLSGKKYMDHAWFIAFAPVTHPKIVVAVIVEHGGWGSSAAAPLARQLFDHYLLAHNDTQEQTYKKFTPQSLKVAESQGLVEEKEGLDDNDTEEE